MKKYEFTGETKQISAINGTVTLHRIKASVAFGNIKSGDIGGWIEREENLSHDGDAWVSDDAWIFGNARVSGDVRASGNVRIFENARVSGDVRISDNAWVHGNAWIHGNVRIYGNAWVSGDVRASGNVRIFGNARVSGDVRASGNVRIFENARVSGDVRISDNAWVHGNAWIHGNVRIYGNAWVYRNKHVLLVGPIGSRNDYTTFFRNRNKGISVSCGCFLGEIDEFIEKVIKTHGENKHASVYRAAAELAKLQIDLSEMEEEE